MWNYITIKQFLSIIISATINLPFLHQETFEENVYMKLTVLYFLYIMFFFLHFIVVVATCHRKYILYFIIKKKY